MELFRGALAGFTLTCAIILISLHNNVWPTNTIDNMLTSLCLTNALVQLGIFIQMIAEK